MAAQRNEKHKKETDTRNYKTRISCINSRNFGQRRGLFRDEEGGKKCEETKRWYMFTQKVWRSCQTRKQKNHNYSGKAGRFVKKMYKDND